MSMKVVTAIAVPAGLILASSLFSYGGGVWAGLNLAPPNLNRGLPSCGNCHASTPGGMGVQAVVTPSARILAPNQSISVTTRATGGQTASTDGGFSSDASAGTFSAGSNSQTSPAADAVTHLASFLSNGRSWTYGYTAPATPGLVQMYVTVNTVNGDMLNGPEDHWAFHNANSTDTTPTPIRLYVNAAGVTGRGDACVGGFGNVPVFGASTSPTVGNNAFALELAGAAPSAPLTVLLGFNAAFQSIDLSIIGVTGCRLHVDQKITLGATTSAGAAARGEGAAKLPLPIPNDPTLRGLQMQAQAAVVDTNSNRAIPLTLSNGLSITIQ